MMMARSGRVVRSIHYFNTSSQHPVPPPPLNSHTLPSPTLITPLPPSDPTPPLPPYPLYHPLTPPLCPHTLCPYHPHPPYPQVRLTRSSSLVWRPSKPPRPSQRRTRRPGKRSEYWKSRWYTIRCSGSGFDRRWRGSMRGCILVPCRGRRVSE